MTDNAVIPADPGNVDYVAYLAWVAQGNTALPVASPTTNQLLAEFVASVQLALDNSDTTMHRIAEGVALGLTTWTTADVASWVSYRRELRAQLHATVVGTLAAKPAYPAGT